MADLQLDLTLWTSQIFRSSREDRRVPAEQVSGRRREVQGQADRHRRRSGGAGRQDVPGLHDEAEGRALILLIFYESDFNLFAWLQGMAVAARSQGKHKQRIWVNISMSGIKIVDEKSGVSPTHFLPFERHISVLNRRFSSLFR